MNAQCTLVYDLPAGHRYKTFRALCGYDSSCDTDNTSASGTTMEFLLYTTRQEPYSFDLTLLGYAADEEVPLYDIWADEQLGTAKGSVTTTVPSHGVRLLRLGNNTSGIGAAELFPVDGEHGVPMAHASLLLGRKGYNLSGQRVDTNYRGVVVKGGRKWIQQ